MKRLATPSILSLLILNLTGCQGLMHELQPHRLWRMNYQEPAGRTDGVYFSVDDPLNVAPTPAVVGQSVHDRVEASPTFSNTSAMN